MFGRAAPLPVPKHGPSGVAWLAIVVVLALLGAVLALSWSGAFNHAQLPSLPSRGSVGLPGSLPAVPTAPPKVPGQAAQMPALGQSGLARSLTSYISEGFVILALIGAGLLLVCVGLHYLHATRLFARALAMSVGLAMGVGLPGIGVLLILLINLIGLGRHLLQDALSSLLGGG